MKRWRPALKHSLTVVLFLFAAVSIFAQFNVVSQNEVGGWAAAADVAGNYGYFIQGNDLTVLNVSGAKIQRIRTMILPSEPAEIKVSGNYLYLFYAGSDSAIQIFNISNPALPVPANRIALNSSWSYRNHIDGNRLYSAMNDKIAILSLDDPESPVVLKEYTISAQTIFHAGNYCYVGNSSGLVVLDVSDLNAIQEKGSLDITVITDILVKGNTAFLAVINDKNGINTVDVSNPDSPRLLARQQLTYTEGSATWIYNPQRIAMDGNQLYAGCSGFETSSLFVINMNQPDAPEVLGSARMDNGQYPSSTSLSLVSPYVYVTTGSSSYGFIKYDVSDANNPVITDCFEELWDAKYLCSDSDKFYAASAERLWVYQALNANEQILLGSSETWPDLERIYAASGIVYAVRDSNLFIIDANDPANMTQLGTYQCPVNGSAYRGVMPKGQDVYLIADVDGGTSFVEVVDVSNMSGPTQKSTLDLAGKARDLFIDPIADRMFVAVGDDNDNTLGFQVIDHSNTQALGVLANHATQGSPSCIWYSDNRVYIGSNHSDETNGNSWFLESFDVTDINQITQKAQTGGAGIIYDVVKKDEYVYASVQGELEGIGKAAGLLDFYESEPANGNRLNGYPGRMILAGGSSSFHQGHLFIFDALTLLGIFSTAIPSSLMIALVSLGGLALTIITYCSGYGSLLPLLFSGSAGLGFLGVGYGGSAVEAIQTTAYQPARYELSQNYPNPFNPETQIEFQLQDIAKTKLTLYDMTGREVRQLFNEVAHPGQYQVKFDATGLPGGIYMYRLEVNGQYEIKKMILLK